MTYPGERVQVDVKVVPRCCIADPELRLFPYTAIDEFTRLRFLAAYPEPSTYSSADFFRRLTAWYARRGIKVECVQTDNGFEFTNRFSGSTRDLPTLFEKTAADLDIRHKLIRPYTPGHNGKVERSHREDPKRFYSCHTFYSLDNFAKQLAVHNRRSNHFPMRPLRWLSPSRRKVAVRRRTGVAIRRRFRDQPRREQPAASSVSRICIMAGAISFSVRVASSRRNVSRNARLFWPSGTPGP